MQVTFCTLSAHKSDSESACGSWHCQSFPLAHSAVISLLPFFVKVIEVVPFFQVQGAPISVPYVQ